MGRGPAPLSWPLHVTLALAPCLLAWELLHTQLLQFSPWQLGWPGPAGWHLVLWLRGPRRSLWGGDLGLGTGWWMGLPAVSGKATCSWCCQGGPRASPADGPSPSPGEGLHQPRLEEEIDFLAQELARQEAGRPGLKAPSQLEGQQQPPEAGETLTRASVWLPTPLIPARFCCANLPSPCSGHPWAFRARPGTRPGPPLHAGSPGAHTPPLPGPRRVVWACAHVPPGAAGRAR